MKTQITLISVFTLLNISIGRLFQESLNVTCFSELLIIGASSFVFWTVFASQIKKMSLRGNILKSPKEFLKHGSIGLGATLLNIVISWGLIVFLMIYVYKCTSPGFSLVNASLTNNIAVNLFCYFVLIFSSLQQQSINKENSFNSHLSSLTFTSGTTTKLVPTSSIEYIETSNNCIIVNTTEGKFVKYQSLKSFLAEVNIPNFKRVHNSYAVNVDYVDSVKKNKNGDGVITLKNKSIIKMSRNYGLML